MAGNATHQLAVLGALGVELRTLDELAQHLPMQRPSISGAISRLVKRELVERIERGQYRLSVAGKAVVERGDKLSSGPRGKLPKPLRRPDTLRQRAWNAMRIRHSFTISDLAMLAATPENRNPEISIAQYVRALAAAGFVAERQGRARGPSDPVTSNGWKVWQLVRDSGLDAPVPRREESDVYDHNTGEAYPCR